MYKTSQKIDHYQVITDTIVAQLEAGVRPWQMNWKVSASEMISRPLRACGDPYKGINVIVLWLAAMRHGYKSSMWMTFNEAKKRGGMVRKGERGTHVVFANRIVKEQADKETGQMVEKVVFFLTGWAVFNVDQIDGLPVPEAKPVASAAERIAHAEEFFANTGATIRNGGDRAYYQPSADLVQMPEFESFDDAEGYYSTLAHEVTHWTGHASRLNRSFDGTRFGDEAYAMEELVAELGAAFLSADLGLSAEPRKDHASYIAGWLKTLKRDKRAIFTAATRATEAVGLLHSLQPAAASVEVVDGVEVVEEMEEAA